MSDKQIAPITPANFQLEQHSVRRFHATVPRLVKDPENPEYWVHVASQMSAGDRVTVLAEDFSFIAEMVVTFAQGTVIKLVQVFYKTMEPVNYDAQPVSKFEVKLRGPKKWCIVNRETGEVVKELIATQSVAYRELEDYLKALAA